MISLCDGLVQLNGARGRCPRSRPTWIGVGADVINRVFCLTFLVGLVPGVVSAQSFETEVRPLVLGTCVRCHGVGTVTPLSFEGLGYDLTDHETFQTWEKVYERLVRGEMPPPAAPQPDPGVVEMVLGSLKRALVDANLAARGEQAGMARHAHSFFLSDALTQGRVGKLSRPKAVGKFDGPQASKLRTALFRAEGANFSEMRRKFPRSVSRKFQSEH